MENQKVKKESDIIIIDDETGKQLNRFAISWNWRERQKYISDMGYEITKVDINGTGDPPLFLIKELIYVRKQTND